MNETLLAVLAAVCEMVSILAAWACATVVVYQKVSEAFSAYFRSVFKTLLAAVGLLACFVAVVCALWAYRSDTTVATIAQFIGLLLIGALVIWTVRNHETIKRRLN